jgi:hypothetical protein
VEREPIPLLAPQHYLVRYVDGQHGGFGQHLLVRVGTKVTVDLHPGGIDCM